MNKQINIIFDFDSTLVTIEGIDKLAKIKGVEDQICTMTNQAMNGQSDLGSIFKQRLQIIKPNRSDLTIVSDLYRNNITFGATELVNNLKEKANIFIVSGGYKCSIMQTANYLGIDEENVFANKLLFDDQDCYQGLEETIPLWKSKGKETVVKQIQKKYPVKTILIGDGFSDLEASKQVNQFICFAGVVKREQVVKKSKRVVYNLDELTILLE